LKQNKFFSFARKMSYDELKENQKALGATILVGLNVSTKISWYWWRMIQSLERDS
jgi:hypothetical protein